MNSPKKSEISRFRIIRRLKLFGRIMNQSASRKFGLMNHSAFRKFILANILPFKIRSFEIRPFDRDPTHENSTH